ncbi:MAG TPA: hypothetical protein VFM34_11025 [Moraxellaceae bacterium]|nr:hypothetical protein [Moraxellaceae bacterium]
MLSQVSRLLGRRQAAYVRRMLQMFESGDLQSALRHAIPLGGEGNSLGQTFGAPSPRSSLTLGQMPGARTNINLGDELNEYLRRLYRQSFERLDREGQSEAAVFVLAELLHNRKEALAYLETLGKYQQAAELALLWDQPSDATVRLLCLAGDWRRAIAVARRDSAFAGAVQMLEQKWPDAARRLRQEWAGTLADQGDWLLAMEAIWPLPEARDQAIAWLLQAEATGGVLAARALVRRAVLLPDTLDRYAEYLTQLRHDNERSVERTALARELLALKAAGSAQPLARLLAGPVLADQARGTGRLDKSSLQRFIGIAGDALLNADLPNQALPAYSPIPLAKARSLLALTPPAPGLLQIRDAVLLEPGRYLLALGEAGAVVVDCSGRILLRLTAPAERLVIAESRQVALALARRDEVWRVSRLDLVRRQVTDMGVTRFDHCADNFSGIAWTLADGNRLRVVDTSQPGLPVLWQVELPGPVTALQANFQLEQLLLTTSPSADVELWRYVLPQRRLVSREYARNPVVGIDLLHPGGGVATVAEQDEAGAPVLIYHHHGRVVKLQSPAEFEARLQRAQNSAEWIVLEQAIPTGESLLSWLSSTDGQPRASVSWPLNASLSLRRDSDSWLVFDLYGRLLHLEMNSGQVTTLSIS